MSNHTRILVVGFGRAGKDEAGLMLSKITDIPYAGSTSWAAKEAVARILGVHPQVAWEKRHEHRQAWKDICDKIREVDPRELFVRALGSVKENLPMRDVYVMQGIVVGIRDRKELLGIKSSGYVDHVLWIARPGIPVDPTVTFTAMDCDEIIFNDGTLDQLRTQLFMWAERKGLVPSRYLTPPTNDRHRE